MHRRIGRLGLGAILFLAATVRAEEGPPKLSLAPDREVASVPLPPRGPDGATAARAGNGLGGVAMTGLALGIALIGGVGLALRRSPVGRSGAVGPLEVVGRVGLTARHSVHLVRAGDRILVIGTGTQGAPALLGEWAAPAGRERGGGS